ncbi:MAG: flavin monoamine oxidase family protein, partial [Nitrosopumilaceae archaeon]
VNEYLDKYVKTEREKENFYYFSYWQYVFDDAADANYVSLKYRDEFAEYPSVEVAFRNGYSQVIDYLDDGLDVRKEHVVMAIDYNGSEVIVSFKNAKGEQQTLPADYVVSTLPLGVLKDKTKVIFSPPIENKLPEKQAAIKRLDMGVYNKVYYIFDEKDFFWEKDKDKDWISRIPGKDEKMGQWGVFFNFYKYTNKPILLAFNSGNYSRQLNEEAVTYSQEKKEQDKYIASKGLEILQKMYPDEKVPPVDNVKTLVTMWEREPYFGGSFSYFTKEAKPSDFDELARPLNNTSGNNKVFFAGEATIQHLYSTVNGAYVTGIRAAEEIQREDKILDAPTTQTEYGMHPAFVVCGKKEHVLIQKSTDHKPFCVAKEIADTLLKREIGNDQMWAIKAEEFPFSEWQESSHPK